MFKSHSGILSIINIFVFLTKLNIIKNKIK